MSQPSESWLDSRSRIVAIESEIENLKLVLEFGESAWANDSSFYHQVVAHLETKLRNTQNELNVAESDLAKDEQKFEKDLSVVERDLFSYLKNNSKVADQVRVLETKAKQLHSDLQELGMSTPEIENKISSLF
jgi:hypothetical protein